MCCTRPDRRRKDRHVKNVKKLVAVHFFLVWGRLAGGWQLSRRGQKITKRAVVPSAHRKCSLEEGSSDRDEGIYDQAQRLPP